MPRRTTTPLPQLIYPRIVNLRRRLKDIIYKPITTNNNGEKVIVEISIGPTHQSFIPWDAAITEEYEPINVGDKFSPASVTNEDGIKEFPWTQRWFRVDIHDLDTTLLQQRKDEGDGQLDDELCLYFLANGEFTVYTSTGDVWCGIDPVHDRIPLTSLFPQGDDGKTASSTITIWLDSGQWQTGFWFGLEPPTDELGFRLLKVQLQQKNTLANEVYHDVSMLIEWIECMYEKEGIPTNTENGYYHPLTTVPPSLRRILHLLNQVCDLYDRTKCLSSLREEIKSIYKVMTRTSEDGGHNMKICHVGHAHMDLVWLWPERVTYQKIVHTYSNVLQLMDNYPEFVFTMSQPPLYYHIQDKQPKLAKRIQEKIHGGKWEFTGALEVEADTQIPVGEGLVRCILYGQERIKAITGRVSHTVWIPDVFGYSQCLPQIFALAEIPNFFTTKILWSTITKFPHNSFVWIGADGEESSVLTHLGVVGYSGKCSMKEAISASRSYQQADVHDEVLCPSGYGDGGGGPSDEQIERSLRLQRSFVGGETPSCRWGTVESFFQRLSVVEDELPLFRGELFLEYHRAVHTTQSDFKYNLRACERSLQTREGLRVISGNWVPLDMTTSWKRYLFALFHDATPGSSIHSVYQDLNAELKLLAEAQYASAVDEWPGQPAAVDSCNTLTIINQLAWDRHAAVELTGDVDDENDPGGNVLSDLVQIVDGKVFAMVKLKGLSATPCITKCTALARNKNTNVNMRATPNSLSNGIITAEFDEYGQLCSMSVRGEPLLLTKNEAASFTLHDDNPEAYDAWDMDHHIVWMKESALKEAVTLRVVACGDVVSILRSGPIPIGSNGSTMEVEYRLYAKQDSLQVSCFVNWMEVHKALRYQLSTQYRGEVARYGSPFNCIDRSQVPQTQKEEGQWEVPASRWASILDGNGNGLSIITQSKYGFRGKMGVLSFTLLRSSTFPDPSADQGKHIIHFAISKHENTFLPGSTEDLIIPTAAKADELFTQPVVLSTYDTSLLPKPFIHFISLGSVVPSWVMPSTSENHRGNSFCIRLHEVSGSNTDISFSILRLDDKMTNVETVNLNEKCLSELEATISDDIGDQEERSCYTLTIRAYKIVTIRISYTS